MLGRKIIMLRNIHKYNTLVVIALTATALASSQAEAKRKKKATPTYEVTNVEWSGGYLKITVFSNSKSSWVSCRAEYEGRAIGGGLGTLEAGVATVLIDAPDALAGKPLPFTFHCEFSKY